MHLPAAAKPWKGKFHSFLDWVALQSRSQQKDAHVFPEIQLCPGSSYVVLFTALSEPFPAGP